MSEESHLPPLTPRPLRRDDPVREHVAAIYAEHDVVYDADFEDDLEDPLTAYASGAFWVVDDAPGILPEGVRPATPLLATAGVVPNGAVRTIKRIYVASAARRLGLARQLLRLAASWGDFEATELWSDVRFRNAHRLYLSEGFVAGPVRVLTDPDRSVERYFRRDERWLRASSRQG